VLAAFLLYELITSFVYYTDDAYVRSDIVSIAPEITGRVTAVHVIDNQNVKLGDPLISIDPVPFQLAVDEQRGAVREAKAQLQADDDSVRTAIQSVVAAESAVVFAKKTRERREELGRQNYMSRESVDEAVDREKRALASLAQMQSIVAERKAAIGVHKAALAKSQAALATAEWKLSRTKIFAPTAGAINHLTVRVGDTANENVPIIGVVDAAAWRIVANYKQSYLGYLSIGKTAWVWLDAHPWRLHRARIDGIGRGISRDPGPIKLLPYVEPTTDWVRLQRRFPVTVVLVDPPPDLTLYMGADARTVIFR
jgi:multidrug efflux system membrane fusion protein